METLAMAARRKSTPTPHKPARRQGLRAKDIQALIALQDWETLGKVAEAEEVSYMTLRSVVRGYQDLAEKGNERAEEILTKLKEAGIKAGFRRRGPRAARIAFDDPITRKIQVVENKKTGNKGYLISGISLKPYVEPQRGIQALPEDLEVRVVYRKKGRIEISW